MQISSFNFPCENPFSRGTDNSSLFQCLPPLFHINILIIFQNYSDTITPTKSMSVHLKTSDNFTKSEFGPVE